MKWVTAANAPNTLAGAAHRSVALNGEDKILAAARLKATNGGKERT
jgi:hypothetical protein